MGLRIVCPGCSKLVETRKGRIPSHVTAGNRKCHWIGQAERVALIFRNDPRKGKLWP